jgi:cell pole-organizing protein PopZ
MAQAAKAQEPSMEEILASIRRIIADDETKPAAPRAAEPPKPAAPAPRPSPPPAPPRATAPPPPPAPSSVSGEIDSLIAAAEPPPMPEVLDLTESMAAPEPPRSPPAFRTIDGQPDVVFADPPSPGPIPPAADMYQGSDRLLSGSASAAVDSAFSSLAQTVLVNNARTLEDLVREMLRPMLKSWLDDNLPGLVERLVRAEIERVSRGR